MEEQIQDAFSNDLRSYENRELDSAGDDDVTSISWPDVSQSLLQIASLPT
jgi:hypothetical protein